MSATVASTLYVRVVLSLRFGVHIPSLTPVFCTGVGAEAVRSGGERG